MRTARYLINILLFMIITVFLNGEQYISHKINAEIFPESNRIIVSNTIRFPEIIKGKIHFLLHGNLKIESISDNVDLKELQGEIKSTFFGINTAQFSVSDKIPLKHYELAVKQKPSNEFSIKYSGRIYHEIKQIGSEYARGFSETPGIISEKGVYLSGSSFWIPWFNKDLVTFRLNVVSPEKWSTVSQGKLIKDIDEKGKHVSEWSSPEPMDEIYLVSAEFHKYRIKKGNVNLYAYMRSPDDNLAMKYLNTTGQYLEMYNKLIGIFPYSKFALIENFWETGYGMPSFTLLGSKILRFPFILHSSYPHELLHNWWGNSVFVDYEKGNWCEGLTVFLADHLIKEQRRQGAEYRRTTLQGYTDYVNDSNEFPVSEFRARSNASSSAIGYGKVMMIFNMLRLKLGDEVFLKGIRNFYKENKFIKTDFSHIEKAFEKVSGLDLSGFFKQWVYMKGAPVLKLSKVSVRGKKGSFKLKFKISQNQKGKPYILEIPAAVYLEGENKVKMINIDMFKKTQTFEYSFKSRPARIDIDPFFDIFRRLSDREIPPSLSKIFGSKEVLIILPEKETDKDIADNYKKLAGKWAVGSKEHFKIVVDDSVENLPADKDIWIIGWDNRFRKIIENEIKSYGSTINKDLFLVGEKSIDRMKNSLILATKNPTDRSRVVVFLSTDNYKALDGLSRKLPHYGKYSYLAFSGEEPVVNLKGQWESDTSPLKKILNKDLKLDHKLPERKALGTLAPLFSSADMLKTIEFLTDKKLEGRGIGGEGINIAADYIADKFKEYGLKPGADNNSYFQEWKAQTGPEKKYITLKNVIGVIPGKKDKYSGQAVVISAHFDHLGKGWPDVRKGNEGKIHPGADDNASGVSVLIELAKNLGRTISPDRSIIFAAFTGEENKLMGSDYFVNNSSMFPVKKMMGVVNLDTVGRLNGKKPLVIGTNSAKEWKFIFMGIGYTTGIESDLINQELDASDQISFIRKGVPGIQIFSGPHLDYHKPTDTLDKIDGEGLIKIARISKEVLVYLSEREEPMTFTGKINTDKLHDPVVSATKSRASIGIMPDFSYSSGGVKVGLAIKSTDGTEHKLKKGDVILSIGGIEVSDLKEYTAVLKKFNPGQKVNIEIKRNEITMQIEVVMRAR